MGMCSVREGQDFSVEAYVICSRYSCLTPVIGSSLPPVLTLAFHMWNKCLFPALGFRASCPSSLFILTTNPVSFGFQGWKQAQRCEATQQGDLLERGVLGGLGY